MKFGHEWKWNDRRSLGDNNDHHGYEPLTTSGMILQVIGPQHKISKPRLTGKALIIFCFWYQTDIGNSLPFLGLEKKHNFSDYPPKHKRKKVKFLLVRSSSQIFQQKQVETSWNIGFGIHPRVQAKMVRSPSWHFLPLLSQASIAGLQNAEPELKIVFF